MKAVNVLAITAIVTGFAACSDDPSGPNTEDGTITVTSMSVVVDDHGLSGSAPSDPTFEVLSGTRVTLDGMTGTTNPVTTPIEMEVGTWSNVLYFVEITPDDATATPSIILTGSFQPPDGGAVPFRWEFNSNERFEIAATTVEVSQSKTLTMDRVFDPELWFPEITLSDATREPDGSIVMSVSSNQAKYQIVADALDASLLRPFASIFP